MPAIADNHDRASYRKFQQLGIITIELAESTRRENPLLSEIPAIWEIMRSR
ncbi:hypothetical protein [Moorena producens]|uniref:hypothetical protein n=1 Tax=Moorena producens TaxID=1155739 RepID=UPI003C715E93